jgi:hypothetical protein
MVDRLEEARPRLAAALRVHGHDSAAALLDSGAPGLGTIVVPELARTVSDAQGDLLRLLETLTRLYPEGGTTQEYHTLYAQRVVAENALVTGQALHRAVSHYYRILDAWAQGVSDAGTSVEDELAALETMLGELEGRG